MPPLKPENQNKINSEEKFESQSMQNDKSGNMSMHIPLDPDYDLGKILTHDRRNNPAYFDPKDENYEAEVLDFSGGFAKEIIPGENVNKPEEAELIDFSEGFPKEIIPEEENNEGEEQPIEKASDSWRYDKGIYNTLSAIQQLVFRARYVAAKGGDVNVLNNKDIWKDLDAERIINNISDGNDPLSNELEGYYLSKCKPIVSEDNSLTEEELNANREENKRLLYNVAMLLDIKTKVGETESDIGRRLEDLEKTVQANTSYNINAEKTFDFLDNVFAPYTFNNSTPLNTKLVGRNSEIRNNEFIPTEDPEFTENRRLINSIRLSDLKEQTNLSNETISAIVAGCFFRPDVLGSTYDQTFSDLENSINPLPGKKTSIPSEQFDVMVDTFFTQTAGGDNRRSANMSLLAVPKARQMARFALGNLTQLSDKRAVVEALENVIRVAGKYAMKHTENDHALYAASKLVNDAMIALDMPQFREISTLTAHERNMARGVSNLYLANVDLIKLNYELHDALIDYQANDLTKEEKQTGKELTKNEDVKRVFDSIYVRRHYIESHLKMAAQYGDKQRPLTSEELACALNPTKYFDSLIKGNNVVKMPEDIGKAKNFDEFSIAFEKFSKNPISNAGINTISASEYNSKLAGALKIMNESVDLAYCASRSNALTKFYSQLERGLRPISSDLLSLYEIRMQRESINSLRSYLKLEGPYENPFSQVILGSLLQEKENRNPEIKKITQPYKLEHFNPRARQFLFNGRQPGNISRIKETVNGFVSALNELDLMLSAVESSRKNETDFIEDCIKDPDKPLGPDIEAQFRKKGMNGISKSAMISKSYKVGQSLGLSELLIHLQETYKSSPKSMIVKKSLSQMKKSESKQSNFDVASRSTRQSRQSKAVQSIRSFVSTRTDISGVSRADNSYSISIDNLEILKDDLSVDADANKNEKINAELEQLKEVKKNEKPKKKYVKKGPSTNWGAKLDPKAEKEPPQLDTFAELSKDVSVKTLKLSDEERSKIYRDTVSKKLELDAQKVKKSIEAKYSNAINNTGLSLIKEDDDEDIYEEDDYINPGQAELDPRIINTGIIDAEFDAQELLNAALPLKKEEQPQPVNQPGQAPEEKEYKLPKALISFNRSLELIRPIDGALASIDECLNGEHLVEEETLAAETLRPMLEATKKYYEEFKNVILSGSNGLSYLYDESGKPTPEFVTMELCKRLYKNELPLPKRGSGEQVDYAALVTDVTKDLSEKYKQFKNPDGRLSYADILIAPTYSRELSEMEIIEDAFEKTKALALDPERLKNLKEIPNPGIRYIVDSAEALYGRLKNVRFADIEANLVDQSGYSFVPRLDYITMRLFSSINSNYDKYVQNPNLFNINNEISKLENELGQLKENGEVFTVTKDNVYYMFGVENPQESKERRTNEKFALREQAVRIKETLTKSLALGGQHYRKLVQDGINNLDIFISSFADYGANRITPTLSDDLTRIVTIKATASTGQKKIRHANAQLTNIQTAINLVKKVVEDNEFKLYDFESAQRAGEERRSVDLKMLDTIDQASNQNEDFAIKLYSDMFASLPDNIDRHIESLSNGIAQTQEYLQHKSELEEQAERERAQAQERERIQAEEKARRQFSEFRTEFDKNIYDHKDEMLTRLKAQKYFCDEMIEGVTNHTIIAPENNFKQLAIEISANCDKLISDINNNKSVFDSFVNAGEMTVNRDYANRRLFKNAVIASFNRGIEIQHNKMSIPGDKLAKRGSLKAVTDDYVDKAVVPSHFRSNISFLNELSMDQINEFIEAHEKKIYLNSPEYKEKLQADQRIEVLLSKLPGEGSELSDDLKSLKAAMDRFVETNSGSLVPVPAVELVSRASQSLAQVISDAGKGKSMFTSLVDKEKSKLTEAGAVLFAALDICEISDKNNTLSMDVSEVGTEKLRTMMPSGFSTDRLSFAVPQPEQFERLLQSEVVHKFNRKEKEAEQIRIARENKRNSPISTQQDCEDLRDILLQNSSEIINNLAVQKIALDKVLAKENENNYSQGMKNLAKLGSDACVDLIKKFTRQDKELAGSIISNYNGKVTFSGNLAILEYCKKAFNISQGSISKKQGFSEADISEKSSDELKGVIMSEIVEPQEKSLTFKQIETSLKDESLQSWFVDIDEIDYVRFDIDEVDYYKEILNAEIEGSGDNSAESQAMEDFAAEKKQLKTLEFNNDTMNRFASDFDTLRRELLKQDAWYHKNPDTYKNVIDKLNKTVDAMYNPGLSGEEKLLKCYTELNSACDAYVSSIKNPKFFTKWGRNRFDQIGDIREIASARIEAVRVSKYKHAIAEDAAGYILEKMNGTKPTQRQIEAQISRGKLKPILDLVFQDKSVDDLQKLSLNPQELKKAVKLASTNFARNSGLLDVKDLPEKEPERVQQQEQLVPH